MSSSSSLIAIAPGPSQSVCVHMEGPKIGGQQSWNGSEIPRNQLDPGGLDGYVTFRNRKYWQSNMPRKKLAPLTDQIRRALNDCGESRYSIAQETGISQSTLAKFMGGTGMSMESLDTLAAYLELEVTTRRKGK